MVYLFLANGFEETEALAPLDMLRRAKIEVKTVGVTGTFVKSSHGVSVITDITIDKYNNDDDMEMVILPGGMPGTLNLEANEKVQSAIDFAISKGAYVAAICAAPSILGHKNLLQGKRAACYTGFEKDLLGATIASDEGVVQDGNIITARGAGVATQFGFKLVEVIKGKEVSDAVRSAILW